MRSRSSFLNDVACETFKGSQVLLFVFSSFGKILTISKGRDKFLGVIQQYSELYKLCMIEYIASYRIKEWPLSLQNANSLSRSIKNARKFFRLLKWVEEITSIGKEVKNKMTMAMVFKIVRHFIGTAYFFLDNLLWFVHMGVINENIGYRKLEAAKDVMSLLRYILRMCIFSMTSHEKAGLEEKLKCSLYNSRNIVKRKTYESSVIGKMIKTRSKRRFQALEMIINILRILMLAKNLKLPGTSVISSIFRTSCGIVSGTFSLFKLLARLQSE